MTDNKYITGARGLAFREPLIFEIGSPGRAGASLPEAEVPEIDPADLYGDLARSDIRDFPEVAEAEVVRHFTRLSQQNFCIDSGMYPLGSCTMKYNPKCHEKWAALPGFAEGHPNGNARNPRRIHRGNGACSRGSAIRSRPRPRSTAQHHAA